MALYYVAALTTLFLLTALLCIVLTIKTTSTSSDKQATLPAASQPALELFLCWDGKFSVTARQEEGSHRTVGRLVSISDVATSRQVSRLAVTVQSTAVVQYEV